MSADGSTGGSSGSLQQRTAAPVGFLELFYDLVFVAATMLLSNSFSHDPTWGSAGKTGLMFVLLWLLWFHTTVLMNVDRRDDLVQRGLVFLQMFIIFLTTLTYVDPLIASVDLVGVGYLGALVIIAIGYHRVCRRPEPVGPWARSRRNRLMAAGLVMAIGIAIPTDLDVIPYAIAILMLAVPSATLAQRRAVPPLDEHHLTERAALLTLVVIGESFVKAGLVISSGSIAGWDVIAIVALFVTLFGLYSMYFDDVPNAGIRPGLVAGELWLLAHLVLQIAVVGLAIGISKFMQTDGDVPPVAIVILLTASAGTFVGLAMISALDRRVPSSSLLMTRLVSIVLIVGVGLVAISMDRFTPGEYLIFLAALTTGNAMVSWRLRRRTSILPPSAMTPLGDPSINEVVR